MAAEGIIPYKKILLYFNSIPYATYRSSVDEDNDHDDNEYNKDDENDLPFVVLPDDEPECLPR